MNTCNKNYTIIFSESIDDGGHRSMRYPSMPLDPLTTISAAMVLTSRGAPNKKYLLLSCWSQATILWLCYLYSPLHTPWSPTRRIHMSPTIAKHLVTGKYHYSNIEAEDRRGKNFNDRPSGLFRDAHKRIWLWCCCCSSLPCKVLGYNDIIISGEHSCSWLNSINRLSIILWPLIQWHL